MRIGELAARTGASVRALRHYEDRGLLSPARTSGDYRDYAQEDIARVARIKAMIDAGLTTASVKDFLGCAHGEEHDVRLDLCPRLRAELRSVAELLDAKQAELQEKRLRLQRLSVSD